MNEKRDFHGKSGAVYRYGLIDGKHPPPLGAGNFIYVRAEPDGSATVLFAGETERLTDGVGERWSEAIETHRATHIYARRNVAARTRWEELADLVSALTPAMNPATPD
jgi:hypothetical protein